MLTLKEVMVLIKEDEANVMQIAESNNYSSPNPVAERLKVAGAKKPRKKPWDFTNINENLLDEDFWGLLKYLPTKSKVMDISPQGLTEDEIVKLRRIIQEHDDTDEKENYTKMLGELQLEQSSYKNAENNEKQLNVPIPEETMKRLDRFLKHLSGFEKRFILYKSINIFLDLYEPLFCEKKSKDDEKVKTVKTE